MAKKLKQPSKNNTNSNNPIQGTNNKQRIKESKPTANVPWPLGLTCVNWERDRDKLTSYCLDSDCTGTIITRQEVVHDESQ